MPNYKMMALVIPKALPKDYSTLLRAKLGAKGGAQGLGLHIIYTLVTGLLGGKIECATANKPGTTLPYSLPLSLPPATPPLWLVFCDQTI